MLVKGLRPGEMSQGQADEADTKEDLDRHLKHLDPSDAWKSMHERGSSTMKKDDFQALW